jgi:hypothetical protein
VGFEVDFVSTTTLLLCYMSHIISSKIFIYFWWNTLTEKGL